MCEGASHDCAWGCEERQPGAKLKVLVELENDNGETKIIEAYYTYGMGWTKPSHTDRWSLLLDVLSLVGTQVDTTGVCWLREMHVDQFESEMFVTIEVFKHF